MTTDEHTASLQFERLTFFSDAVFAIAITVLVLDLRLPPSHDHLLHLEAIQTKFIGFGISFVVIGIYWMAHHRLFGTLKIEDSRLRVVNLAFLASVVFLPFPTSVIAEYSADKNAVIFYALSVSVVGLLLVALLFVARRPSLMGPGETRGETYHLAIRALAPPVVFLVSAGVACSQPGWAVLLWVLVWPVWWVSERLGRRVQLRVDGDLSGTLPAAERQLES